MSRVTAPYKTQNITLAQDLKDAGLVDTVTMVTFPLARNKIMIRLENIGDIYDNAAETTVQLKDIALTLCYYANSMNTFYMWPEVTITEMSLTGNMPLEELKKRKIQWLTRDDAILNRK